MEDRLSVNKINRYEPTNKDYFVWDTKHTGLGLKVNAGGTKSFVFQDRLAGTGYPKRRTIGQYPTISLQQAIAIAQDWSVLYSKGIDPKTLAADQVVENERKAEEISKRSLTVGDLFTDYVHRHKFEPGIKERWSRTYTEDHYEAARPHFGQASYKPQPIGLIWNTHLKDLSSDFVEEWVRRENDTRPTSASKSFRMLKACANWSSDTGKYAGLIPAKTFNSKKVNKAVQPVRASKGVLQKQQLPTWFKLIDQIEYVQRAALICMLINGSRPSEMLTLEWENVDFKWDTITITDKVDQWSRKIPLTPYVKQVMRSLPRLNNYVFGSLSTKSGHIEITKKYRYLQSIYQLPNLPPKSMRKSFRTLSEWVEMPYGISSQIMGHRPSAIDEKHYIERPIDLLRMWHIKIERFILSEAGVDTSELYSDD